MEDDEHVVSYSSRGSNSTKRERRLDYFPEELHWERIGEQEQREGFPRGSGHCAEAEKEFI
jgi:hypothetical protein